MNPPKGAAPLPPKLTSNATQKLQSQNSAIEQKNRLLSVMIPRAKYHSQQSNGADSQLPQQQQQHHHHHHHHQSSKQDGKQNNPSTSLAVPDFSHTNKTMGAAATDSVISTAEAKLLSYLDASPSKVSVTIICNSIL